MCCLKEIPYVIPVETFYFEKFPYLQSFLIQVLPYPSAQLIGRQQHKGKKQERGTCVGNLASALPLLVEQPFYFRVHFTVQFQPDALRVHVHLWGFLRADMLAGSSQEYECLLIATMCGSAGMESHSRLPHQGSALVCLAVQLMWATMWGEIPNSIVEILFQWFCSVYPSSF